MSSNKKKQTCTALIADHIADDLSQYAEQDGECCFCSCKTGGVPEEDVLSYKYFTDFQLMQEQTGHICKYCAFCMKERSIRQGCWIVHPDGFEKVKSGDLLNVFQQITDQQYEPPFAFRITPDPMKSQHAYHWTPVTYSTETFPLSFGKQQLTVDWDELQQVVAAIEELRANRFRLDDIRSAEPRVSALEQIGAERYNTISTYLDRYRGSTLFELAITVSRAEKDQDDTLYFED